MIRWLSWARDPRERLEKRIVLLIGVIAAVCAQIYFLTTSPNTFGEQSVVPMVPYEYEDFIRVNYRDRLGAAGDLYNLLSSKDRKVLVVDNRLTLQWRALGTDDWTSLLPILLPAFSGFAEVRSCSVPSSLRQRLTSGPASVRSEYVELREWLSGSSGAYLLTNGGRADLLAVSEIPSTAQWSDAC